MYLTGEDCSSVIRELQGRYLPILNKAMSIAQQDIGSLAEWLRIIYQEASHTRTLSAFGGFDLLVWQLASYLRQEPLESILLQVKESLPDCVRSRGVLEHPTNASSGRLPQLFVPVSLGIPVWVAQFFLSVAPTSDVKIKVDRTFSLKEAKNWLRFCPRRHLEI